MPRIRLSVALRGLAAALALTLLAPIQAWAGYANAVGELKVLVEAEANANIGMTWINLPVGSTGPSGYGDHAEDADGTASFDEGIYTIQLFSEAYATSPPNSRSQIATFVRPGAFAVFTNTTETVQSLVLTLAGVIDLSAVSDEGFALAGAAYRVRGAGDGGDLSFADALSFSGGFRSRTFEGLQEVAITPGGTYRLYLDRAATRAVAVVPEPSTWALMIAGFGLAGASLRRRAGPAPVHVRFRRRVAPCPHQRPSRSPVPR